MELDSGADSVCSTPRSLHHQKAADDKAAGVVRMMCSFGGKILPRPHDNQLRYVGGDTRIVAVHRSTSFSSLLSKLSKLLPENLTNRGGATNYTDPLMTVKYQLPNEDLDALITVSTDEDVENMMEEFDRLALQSSNSTTTTTSTTTNNNNNQTNSSRVPRLRLFLFPNTGDHEDSRTSSIASLLDGSRKRENWFLDALNGGSGTAPTGLERGRSEVSSIVSEVPDYLFGLDNSDEPVVVPKMKNRTGLSDVVFSGSAPGSPAPAVSAGSPFGSTSSAPPMPNLPPVKTKLEKPVEDVGEPVEPAVQFPVGYSQGGPVWGHHNVNPMPNPGSPYTGHHHPMQPIPVYYVPSPVARGNPHMQPVSVPIPVQVSGTSHYVPQYGAVSSVGQVPIQVPVGYPGSGPMYGGGAVRSIGAVDPYEMQVQGNMVPVSGGPGQPVYYGVKNTGATMIAGYPGMGVPVTGDEPVVSGSDGNKARSLPA